MASVTILSDNGATSGSAGLKTSGGNDGVLLLQTTTSGGTPTTAISISNTQVVTYTNQPTYTGGTANGVLYLNGSKAVTSGTALVFDGTNLGLGVTPSAWSLKALQVNGASIFGYTALNANIGANFYYDGSANKYIANGAAELLQLDAGAFKFFNAPSGTAGNAISFTQAMTLDASGNLGLGVTPSATAGAWKAIELVNAGNCLVGGYGEIDLANNLKYDRVGSFSYVSTGYASRFVQSGGVFTWNSGTGTAGAAASLTQAMTLDTSGRLGIGTTNPSEKLEVNGAIKAANSITIGSNGTYAAGSIYSDGNWGMIFRAKQSSPVVADFLWMNASDTERMRLSTAGNLTTIGSVTSVGVTSTSDIGMSNGKLNTVTGGGSCAAGGQFLLNLEGAAGLYTNGLLMLRGNENGTNQTIRIYMWNISYYSPTSTRSVGLKVVSYQSLNNGYGDVYAYLSNYSGSYTTADQTNSGNTSAASDIYIRNAVGAGCTYSYTLWRSG